MILSALITTAVVIGSLFAIAADGRHGNSDPGWAYLLVVGFGLAIGALLFFVASKARDAAMSRRYDTGEE